MEAVAKEKVEVDKQAQAHVLVGGSPSDPKVDDVGRGAVPVIQGRALDANSVQPSYVPFNERRERLCTEIRRLLSDNTPVSDRLPPSNQRPALYSRFAVLVDIKSRFKALQAGRDKDLKGEAEEKAQMLAARSRVVKVASAVWNFLPSVRKGKPQVVVETDAQILCDLDLEIVEQATKVVRCCRYEYDELQLKKGNSEELDNVFALVTGSMAQFIGALPADSTVNVRTYNREVESVQRCIAAGRAPKPRVEVRFAGVKGFLEAANARLLQNVDSMAKVCLASVQEGGVSKEGFAESTSDSAAAAKELDELFDQLKLGELEARLMDEKLPVVCAFLNMVTTRLSGKGITCTRANAPFLAAFVDKLLAGGIPEVLIRSACSFSSSLFSEER